MAAPEGISLKPGQFIVSPITSSSSGVNSAIVQSGTIEQSYSKQMAYNVGQVISFFNKGAVSFAKNEAPYFLVDQKDILFKVTLPV